MNMTPSSLVCCSVSAQTGTADTIYVDVPAEVEALRMQTTDCIAVGKKAYDDKNHERFQITVERNDACLHL